MANPIPNLFRAPELKNKILFTLFIMLIYRIGSHITVPGVDVGALQELAGQFSQTFLGVYDMFVGGGLSRATILALGIMPYISASIMFQLLAAVFPTVQKLQMEGEQGRKKLTQWTRYTTVLLCVIQAFAYASFLQGLGERGSRTRRELRLHHRRRSDRRRRLRHVAGRADHRARGRQRHVAHDLLLDHPGLSRRRGAHLGVAHGGRDRAVRGDCAAGGPGGHHGREWWA